MEESADWIRAARVEDVPPGHGYETDIEVDGELVGLFNIEGEIFALGECPHEQGPLCQGRISGHKVRCPWHSATFDVRSGECLEGPVACRTDGNVATSATAAIALTGSRTFATRVADGYIYVSTGGR